MRARALSVTCIPLAGAVFGASSVSVVIILNLRAFAALDRRGRLSLHYFAATASGFATSCFFFQSPIAARMASSAKTEQWIFTGGNESSFTISVFLIARASSTVLPFTHSVASEDEAMAEPQPKVLNLASSMMLVCGLTLIWSFITSPHSGAPTRPVPTSELLLSSDPTLRGLL